MPKTIPTFDDLDAAGWDDRFADQEAALDRPTLSVSWDEIDGNVHYSYDKPTVWSVGASTSTAFELDGTRLTPAEVVEFAESSRLYPGYQARYLLVHRIAGFPVLRVQVDLDGNGTLPDEEVVHTVYKAKEGVLHDVTAHVQFVPILSKVCGEVLAEVARYTVQQVLASKQKDK